MDDDELLGLIRDLNAADRPPLRLVENAYQSRTWADIDGELAAALEDSAGSILAGVRSDDEARRLVFESTIGVIDLTIEPATGTLSGRLDPAATIEIQRPDGTDVAVNEGSSITSFRVTGLSSGPLRLRIETVDGVWVTQSCTL